MNMESIFETLGDILRPEQLEEVTIKFKVTDDEWNELIDGLNATGKEWELI
jgi:hypothetical protein